MKKTLLIVLLVPCLVKAQTITTVIGNGSSGDNGDGGAAISAQTHGPGSISFDAEGNLFIGNPYKLRKVSLGGIISTLAGKTTTGFNGDGGLATTAELNHVTGVAKDGSGNIFIADSYNNRIRKINTAGIISTIAGINTGGFGGDGGPSTLAKLYSPSDICLDNAGNLYIADHSNKRIRKINTAGIISTIAGTGISIVNGDGGPATAAGIGGVTGLCLDNLGNLYLTDGYSKVRKISLATGIISTVAGKSTAGFSGDGGPATAAELSGPWYIAIDFFGNIFTSDYANNRIRMINKAGTIFTVAGNGIGGYNGDGISATLASLYSPRGIALDSCGNLYIGDNGNHRVRKIIFNPPPCAYLGIDEQTTHAISIYPNPANNELHIDNAKPGTKYDVVSIVGAVVHSGTLQAKENSISIRNLPPGIYLLALTNEQGIRTIHKIIKE